MKLQELVGESLTVLKVNKMRTGLSILGIIIGIGSVIALMTLGEASQQSVKQRIEALGSNLLVIRPGSSSSGFLRGGGGDVSTLKLADAQAIADSNRINTVENVAAEYTSAVQAAYGKNNTRVTVAGVTPNYFSIRNIELTLGRSISQSDIDLLTKVAVISPTTAEELFGQTTRYLGQTIKLDGNTFTIVGVTEATGSTGRSSGSETVYVPLSTAQRILFGVSHISSIYVQARNEDVMAAAHNQIGYLLLERHKLKTPADADFSITSQADLLETVTEVTETFTMLLTGIAAISLIVGGIGIMNIMLITVTERTREIGIRKALGAKKKTIILQFLIESIILTVMGGIMGVGLGLGVSVLLTHLMSLPTIIAYNSIMLAVVVACCIGLVFGWYPAQKAAKLQPIEALRYE